MIATTDDLDAEVDHRPASEHATLHRFGYSSFHCWRMLLRDVAGGSAIFVNVPTPAIGRLDHEADMSVFPARAHLTDKLVLALAAAGHRFAIRDLRMTDARLHAELAAEAIHDDLQVELAHAADHDLSAFRIGVNAE